MAGKSFVQVTIAGDASGAKKAFSETEDAAGTFGINVGKKALAAVGGIAAVTEGVQFLGSALKDAAADDAEQRIFEQQLKLAGGTEQTTAAFNDLIDSGMKLKGFTDTELREAYGQAFSQSQDLASSQADVALAMDLSRTAGVDLNTALDAVTKAHNGNSKALKTLVPQFGSMIAGAKDSSQALELVRRATQGTADTFANTAQGQMQRAKIQFGELKESVGAALLPAMVRLTGFLNDTLIPGMQRVADWVQVNWPQIRATIVDAVEKVWGYVEPVIHALQALWAQFGDNVLNFVREDLNALVDIFSGAFEVIQGVFRFFADLFTGKWSNLGDDIGKIVGGFGKILKGAFEGAWAEFKLVWGVLWDGLKTTVGGLVDDVVSTITGLPGRLGDAVTKMGELGAGMGKAFANALIEAVNWVIRKVNDVTKIGSKSVMGVTVFPGWDGLQLPEMKKFHTGGIVPGVRETPALLMGGEGVFTSDQMQALGMNLTARGSRGGQTIVNNTFQVDVKVPVGADKAAIGREVADALIAASRRYGVVLPVGVAA